MESASEGSPKEKKRKLVIEKATGPAWGAHSYSANKNYAINKSMQESGKDPGFGNFGRYFSEKKRKLRDQYHQDATTAAFLGEVPDGPAALNDVPKIENTAVSGDSPKLLFQGISIFVDGFTTPTHQELRFLMMNHGGVFENYFSSQRVTHIVCSTLPDSKISNPRLMSRGLPIVKPEWIADSIRENRLLSWENYQLERLAFSHPHQRTLAAAFSVQKVEDSSACSRAPGRIVKNVERHSSLNLSSEMPPPPVDARGEPASRVMANPSTGDCEKASEDIANAEVLAPHASSVSKADAGARIEPELASGCHGPIVPNEDVQKQLKKKPSPGRGHSTLDDPDFVQSYFKYSRLHFIGTWRTRYQNLVNAGTFGHSEEGTGALPVATSDGSPAIIHLDMDCFFVSVVVRKQPNLNGKPVVVCHSKSVQGTGEISSANYPARSYGVRAGMFVRDAKSRCPKLTIVPYDFAAYEEVADKVYSILHRHCSKVQAVSCDEAFLDVTGHPEPAALASRIREEIFEATQCTASAGIAGNLLLARLATKKAKPNGQFVIEPHEVKHFMAALPLDELPGVGWTLREKLHGNGLYNCADLQLLSKEALQKAYGIKTGVMLWLYAQGIDEREVRPAQERKSIGAEVNWGVRFSCQDDAQQFLVNLSNEVATRLQQASLSGRTITLKVKRRKEGVGEPTKFMGCGVCDNLSRSETLGYPTNSVEVLLRISRQIFASLRHDVQEVRGVGLQVSRLVSTSAHTLKQHNALQSWLAPATVLAGDKQMKNSAENDQFRPANEGLEQKPDFKTVFPAPAISEMRMPKNVQLDNQRTTEIQKEADTKPDLKAVLFAPGISDGQTHNVQLDNQRSIEIKKEAGTFLAVPPLSQIDPSVLEFLPEDIVAEIHDANKAKEEQAEGEHLDSKAGNQSQVMSAMKRPGDGQLHSRTRKNGSKARKSSFQLPPQSQLDPSVLASLPEDVLAEINHAYEQELKKKPARTQSCSPVPNIQAASSGDVSRLQEETPITLPSVADKISESTTDLNQSENFGSLPWSTLANETIFGQPRSFQKPGYEDCHTMLQYLIGSINSGQSCQSLSSSLLSLGSCFPKNDGTDMSCLEQFIQQCFQLLIVQVRDIALKDLEEVQLTLLYLTRLGSRCNFWMAVQELVVPTAKDIIAELYGAQLRSN